MAPPFLTSAQGGDEWSASRPGLFIPQRDRPRYPLDRRLDGPQSRSRRCGAEKNLAPAGIRNPAVQPVAIPTELSRLHFPYSYSLKFSNVENFYLMLLCYQQLFLQ
jgi:hypothetical protein